MYSAGEQLRHRFPWFAGVVLIQTRYDHSHTLFGQFVDDE
jgi:hypothetical protein